MRGRWAVPLVIAVVSSGCFGPVIVEEETGAVVEVPPQAIPEPPPPVAIEPDGPVEGGEPSWLDVDFNEEYGCGTGLWVGTQDQRLALHATYVGDPALPLPDVALPSDHWEVRVQVGRDLFANWCDDVVEPGEPEPILDQEWMAVDGAVRVLEQPGGDCPSTAVVEVTGLVVQRPNGRMVRVQDLTIANRSWGCFAG